MPDEALRIAEKIRGDIEAWQRLEGEDVDLSNVTASVGVATFPDHAADADGLFRRRPMPPCIRSSAPARTAFDARLCVKPERRLA